MLIVLTSSVCCVALRVSELGFCEGRGMGDGGRGRTDRLGSCTHCINPNPP